MIPEPTRNNQKKKEKDNETRKKINREWTYESHRTIHRHASWITVSCSLVREGNNQHLVVP
jgi:hypothetical protein